MSAQTYSLAERQFMEWAHLLAEGKNPYSAVAEEKIEEMHALAYFLYGQQHYLDASYIFRQLTIARPSEAKYWKGLGACLQMLKDYNDALNCYVSAQLLNGESPDPYLYLYAADCYLALKEVKSGFKALEAAKIQAKKINDQRVLQHVKLMNEMWSNNIK